MSWISGLDSYGYNFLIDELVWHLEKGREPVSVLLSKGESKSGYEFHFSNSETAFLEVNSEMIEEHWLEAKEIVESFSQLRGLRFVHS
ncbi:hypothetical protein [Microbulbifer sp. M83]|uniref:hypothetical protein n=1 Tax=Microbulbifer sp. M83 TaxID=3118246 RepID=UPI002FDF30B1